MEANPNCPKCHASAVYRNGKVLGETKVSLQGVWIPIYSHYAKRPSGT